MTSLEPLIDLDWEPPKQETKVAQLESIASTMIDQQADALKALGGDASSVADPDTPLPMLCQTYTVRAVCEGAMGEESPMPSATKVNETRSIEDGASRNKSAVIRRITMDVASGQIVEDINVNQVDGSTYNGPLSLGTMNVETRFYYQMEDDDAEAGATKTAGGMIQSDWR